MKQNDFQNNRPDRSSSLRPRIATEEVAEKFATKMEEIGLKEKERETVSQAQTLGVEYVNLKGFAISPEALVIIQEEEAVRLQTICFFLGASDIRLGSLQPNDPAVQALAARFEKDYHASVTVYLISQRSFDFAIKLYQAVPKVRKFVSGVEITEEEIKRFEREVRTFKELNLKLREVSVTDMVTLIIASAIKARSSDIHIEAEEKSIKIRFRIDGILHDAAALEHKIWPQIISRIKLVAKLKINIEDRPQDGRFTIFLTSEKIDVRVSTLPTAYGESVVMRLLMSSAVGLAFEDMGLRGKPFEILTAEIEKPNGMIVTTGPTGSGKTTTLYAVLNKLNDPGTKIITIEDPIEYKLAGINQSQVDHGKGYTLPTVYAIFCVRILTS